MVRNLERPIIVVGAARSGTTLLGGLLGRHRDVAYWEEPTHIWRHRHAYRGHDVLTAHDATPKVAAYIRRQFADFLHESGKERFLEKTPSNCFRIPFIREVFPDVQIVHLVRDGRAVAVSAMGQWHHGLVVRRTADEAGQTINTSYGGPSETRGFVEGIRSALYAVGKFILDTRRLAGGIWTMLEAPAYMPGLMRTFARKLAKNGSFVWGPRFPGIREFHRTCSLLETCAFQWALSVQSVLVHTRDMKPDQYLEVRYESLVRDPESVLREICRFADLPWAQVLSIAAAETVRPLSRDRWLRAISDREAELLQEWLGPLSKALRYTL